jgi:multidrug efflux system membrane fusion protein
VLEDTVVPAALVRRRHVTLGQYVRAGDPLVEIVDRSRLRVRFRVTEAESVLLAKDQPLTFRVPSLSNDEHAAVLVHVDETASPVSRMVECLGEAREAPEALKPGFFVVAAVERTASDVLHVAEEALLPGEQGWIAFVVVDGVARRRALRLGMRSRDGRIEVLDGLKEGEALIVKGARIVSEGQAVTATAAAPAGAPPAPPAPADPAPSPSGR